MQAHPITHHMQALWGRLWLLPVAGFALYLAILAALHDLRPEPVAVTVLLLSLAYGSRGSKRFFVNFSPFILFLIGYDLFRYVQRFTATPNRVLSCELRDLDMLLFPASAGQTVQEWLASHPAPVLDLVCAVPYTIHVYVAVLYGIFLFFRDRSRMRHYLLGVSLANFAAFFIWALLPAAPPWYVHAYGCGIDPAAVPSAAGLLRVDQLTGTELYQSIYSRNSSVFAALPSMHNGFAMAGLLSSWRHIGWNTRWLHLLYVGTMFFASLYLDHHWMVDALAGWGVAAVGVFLSGWVLRRFADRPNSPHATTLQVSRVV